MKKIVSNFLFILLAIPLFASTSFTTAQADSREEIDVNYLQTCLKEEDSTLDVLILMDSSKSLRDARPEEKASRQIDEGSDPDGRRGPILESSLKLLRKLSEESNSSLRISLRNFGNNSNESELKKLQERWIDWTDQTSDQDLEEFRKNAVYDESPGTEWDNGLITARKAFNERFSDPKFEGRKSCPIMFWITDGAPDDPKVAKSRICQRTSEASIEWFRERNILVLGGLLKPPNEDTSSFSEIVTGSDCGANEATWTKGSVIEADDVGALAWGFVGLIAKIKNLLSLGAENGVVVTDPGTRVLEIFIKGNPTDWKIKAPDGSVYCSKAQTNGKCEVDDGKDIGITSIRISSESSPLPSGRWIVEAANLKVDSSKVFGGVNGKLLVSDDNKSIEEDQSIDYKVQLQNPDGSAFDISGYESIEICGTVASTKKVVCKSGSAFASISLTPGTTDKTISFEAVLVSSQDSERRYKFFETVKVNVQESKKYPSLVCPSSTKEVSCVLADLPNKNKPGESILRIEEAKLGSSGGKIYLLGYTITSDQIAERGNEKFLFNAQTSEGQEIEWNNKARLLSPGEELKLLVSTEIGGTSKIKGNIKYAVIQDGQEVVRQLDFEFGVGAKRNWPLLIALVLAAYLLTVGIPYLYLLWTAKRAAFLSVPDDQIAYHVATIRITNQGKLVSVAESGTDTTLVTPSHKSLTKQEIETGIRSVQVGPALIEVVPPKWNPFVEPRTTVSIPGHHVLSTYGEKAFQANEATFSSNLANEGVIYFASEENLAPVIQTQIETNGNADQMAVFASSYEERIKEEPAKRVGEVNGQVLFIIPALCNYKRMLGELTSKLISASDSSNLHQHIEELRQQRLDDLIAEREAAKKLAESEAAKETKKGKRAGKNGGDSVVTEIQKDPAMDSNPFLDNNENTPNIWGDDGKNFPDEDKKGPSIWG